MKKVMDIVLSCAPSAAAVRHCCSLVYGVLLVGFKADLTSVIFQNS